MLQPFCCKFRTAGLGQRSPDRVSKKRRIMAGTTVSWCFCDVLFILTLSVNNSAFGAQQGLLEKVAWRVRLCVDLYATSAESRK